MVAYYLAGARCGRSAQTGGDIVLYQTSAGEKLQVRLLLLNLLLLILCPFFISCFRSKEESNEQEVEQLAPFLEEKKREGREKGRRRGETRVRLDLEEGGRRGERIINGHSPASAGPLAPEHVRGRRRSRRLGGETRGAQRSLSGEKQHWKILAISSQTGQYWP